MEKIQREILFIWRKYIGLNRKKNFGRMEKFLCREID